MARFRRHLPQQRRLVAAAIYLFLVILLAKYLNGQFIPPFGLDGLWFWVAFAAILLGELLMEPFFTTPKDAIANSVAIGVAAASVSTTGAAIHASTIRMGRIALIGLALTVILAAVVSILLKDQGPGPRRLAEFLSRRVAEAGDAGFLFGIALLMAGYAAFADDSAKLALLYVSWFAMVTVEPAERLLGISRPRKPEAVEGEVVRIEDPGILVAQIQAPEGWSLGARVAIAGSEIGNVVDVTSSFEHGLIRIALDDPGRAVPLESAVTLVRIDLEALLVGHVSPGTSTGELVVDASSQVGRMGLREGRLLSAPVRDGSALFQVVRGEIVRKADGELERDLVRITAGKLGRWDEASTSFQPVPWVPDPGRPVELLRVTGRTRFLPELIGFVPETDFGIAVDVDRLVTHNTAILGILGIGKTHLAWELMKRMLVEGIRVVALDITGRYASHFKETCPPSTQRAFEAAIDAAIESTADDTSVRGNEAGNVNEFRAVVHQLLRKFGEGDGRLLILNPNHFRVTRMIGGINFKDGRANQLSELTMVDTTAIIAEEVLRWTQDEDQREIEGRGVDDASPTSGDPPTRLCLVLEEAHSLVPEFNSVSQKDENRSVAVTSRAILQGRKYGYGCLLITQRTANVTKSILNQCNTVFALRNYDATGVGFLENYIGPAFARTLATLEDREAVVFGRASSCNAPIIVQLNDAFELDQEFWSPRVDDVPVTSPPPPPDDNPPPPADLPDPASHALD